MARGAITVKIDGKYDDKDLNRAIKDLNALRTQSGVASKGMGGLTDSWKKFAAFTGAGMILGGVVSGLADFAKEAVGAALEAKKADDRLNQIAKSMGVLDTVLGGTTNRLTDYAQSLQDATGVQDETVKGAQAILLTFKELAGTAGTAGGMFDRATAALLDLSAAGFGDATTNAKSLGKALQDPIKGLTALGRQGITFTDIEKEKIKALVASNQTLEAQGLIMAAVEAQVGGTAKAVATDFDKIGAALSDVKEQIGFALLDSITSTTDALGGSDGLIPVIRLGGDVITDMVTGVGQLTAELAKFAAQSSASASGGNDLGTTLTTITDVGLKLVGLAPGLGQIVTVTAAGGLALGDFGKRTGDAAEQMDALRESSAANDVTLPMFSRNLVAATGAAADAATAMEDLKEITDAYLGAISLSQSLDNFRTMLANLDEELKGNARSFKGLSEAAKENRDALRDALADDAANAKTWAEQSGASSDELTARMKQGRKDIIDAFVKQGFTRKEIKAFLGAEGIWGQSIQDTVNAGANAAATAAKAAGKSLGYDLATGLPVGMAAAQSVVNRGAVDLVNEAEAAARAATETESPSRVWAVLGTDLADGLSVGLTASQAKTAAAAVALVAAAGKAALEEARSQREQAKAAMASVSDGIVGQVLGSASFSTTDAEGNALTPEQIMQSILGSTQNQGNAVAAIASSIGAKLPPALLSQILAMPPETAIALANYLGAHPDLITQLNWNYEALSKLTETTLGVPMGKAWAMVGDQSAKDMLIAARAVIAERAGNFSAWVAKQLETTVDVRVNFRGSGIDGARAGGGPITAGRWLVGEKGPEIVDVGSSGFVHSNASLSGGASALGGSVTFAPTINFNGVVGDPRVAGQQVVEVAEKFFKSNGRTWARA